MLDMSGKLSIMNHNHFDPSLTFYMYYLISIWMWNFKYFGQESTYSNEKKIRRWMSVRQKLFIILENKVVQILKLENNVFTIKWSPNLMFLKKERKEFGWFLSLKIDFESMISAFFDKPSFIYGIFSKKIFEYVDSWPKILLVRTHHLWNSTTVLHIYFLHICRILGASM